MATTGPSPLIATYSDWSRASPLPVQARYEPLPNYVPKRTYRPTPSSPFTHEVRRPVNKYSLGEVLVMDTCQRPATAVPVPHKAKACQAAGLARKAPLTGEGSRQGGLEGKCEQWMRPMTPKGLWLYRDLKPEDHFTGKREVKRVRVSEEMQAVRDFIEERKSQKAMAPIPALTEYISTDGKDVIATINAALGDPKPENPPSDPTIPSQILPEAPIDAEKEPIESLEDRIQALEAKAAVLSANLTKRTEYQAEFTAANSLTGRVESFKPAAAHISYFL